MKESSLHYEQYLFKKKLYYNIYFILLDGSSNLFESKISNEDFHDINQSFLFN